MNALTRSSAIKFDIETLSDLDQHFLAQPLVQLRSPTSGSI
jgi:hypothetical protein